MFRVSKPTGTYLRAVLKMGGPAQNDAWHDASLESGIRNPESRHPLKPVLQQKSGLI